MCCKHRLQELEVSCWCLKWLSLKIDTTQIQQFSIGYPAVIIIFHVETVETAINWGIVCHLAGPRLSLLRWRTWVRTSPKQPWEDGCKPNGVGFGLLSWRNMRNRFTVLRAERLFGWREIKLNTLNAFGELLRPTSADRIRRIWSMALFGKSGVLNSSEMW